MEIIFRRLNQLYRNSIGDRPGFMLVLLEDGEDKDEVIKNIHANNTNLSYNIFYEELISYNLTKEETITGTLLLFKSMDLRPW